MKVLRKEQLEIFMARLRNRGMITRISLVNFQDIRFQSQTQTLISIRDLQILIKDVTFTLQILEILTVTVKLITQILVVRMEIATFITQILLHLINIHLLLKNLRQNPIETSIIKDVTGNFQLMAMDSSQILLQTQAIQTNITTTLLKL
jgi:hypothetical protein